MKKQELKQIILNGFNASNLNEVVKQLKSQATNEYGCLFAEKKLQNGIRISYNDNKNCWASVLVTVGKVGMSSQLALRKKDIRSKDYSLQNQYLF